VVDQDPTESLALAPQPGRRLTAPRLLDFLTHNSTEQSQNVYENKGRVQKVEELRS